MTTRTTISKQSVLSSSRGISIAPVKLALLTEFVDRPPDVLLLRLPTIYDVTLALLTEFVDRHQ
jgi:hypothetical protein